LRIGILTPRHDAFKRPFDSIAFRYGKLGSGDGRANIVINDRRFGEQEGMQNAR